VLRGDFFARVVAVAVRRPLVVIGVVLALVLVGSALALRLESSASTRTLADPDSESFQEAERFKKEFGEDAVVVLIEGDLQRTLLTQDLRKVFDLEACLTAQVAGESGAALPRPCQELGREKPVKVVYGPANLINRSSVEIGKALQSRLGKRESDAEAQAALATRLARQQGASPARQKELAAAARQLVVQQSNQELIALAVRYGIARPPRPDDPAFVSKLIFDTARGADVPKARFAYLFPSSKAALIQVRLKPDLSEAQKKRAIELIRAATRDDAFRLESGGRYVVTGVPVVVAGLATAVERSIFVLLGAALLIMALTLALVFRSRLRLLPLAVAGSAAALTYGAVSLAGASLTMASIAALPVLIGLAVDYAIQFQARFNEASARGRTAAEASHIAAVSGGPTIASAGLATAVGFLVLLLSPVPMVRGFGVVLVLGILLAFGCALTAGFAVLSRFSAARPRPSDVPPVMPRVRAGIRQLGGKVVGTRPGARARGVWRSLRVAVSGAARTALTTAIERPRRVLAIGLAVALVGLVADTQSEVVSDVRELVPRDLPALQDAEALERASGITGEIDVTVRADDLTRPEVLSWMTSYQSDVLRSNGYSPGSSCAQEENAPDLCPALSLPDLLRSTDIGNQDAVRALLGQVPEYFSRAVISDDRKLANLAFGIRLMPADQQRDVIRDMEKRLDPPAGVEAKVTGLPVLFSEATAALSSPWRRLLTLAAGLAAVFLVLLAVRRRSRLAAVPLIPIALATGWSALVLFALRIPLNPMSASLGALVIAISTEFSVLLSARYAEEREAGADPRRALELTYESTGAAVLASGATAIAGFAALIASDIRMLRDFGIVTVVDLTVSLLGVMIVLPAALVWAEEHGPFTLSDLDPRARLRGLRAGLAGGSARRLAGRLRPPRTRAGVGARSSVGSSGTGLKPRRRRTRA